MQLVWLKFLLHDHCKMSASAQRPCVLQEVIAVTGGGIDPTAGFGNAWMIKPTVFDGKTFWEIYVGCHLCKQFVHNQFGMVEHIKKAQEYEGACTHAGAK